jgi:hypothetical protein
MCQLLQFSRPCEMGIVLKDKCRKCRERLGVVPWNACANICMCTYVRTYVCMYVRIYMYIYIHTHIRPQHGNFAERQDH